MASSRARFLRFSFEHDTIVEISYAAEVVAVNMETAEIVQVDMVSEMLLVKPLYRASRHGTIVPINKLKKPKGVRYANC